MATNFYPPVANLFLFCYEMDFMMSLSDEKQPDIIDAFKANTSDTKAMFLDLHLSISNDIVSIKIYNKHDDSDFEIVNFPFLDGGVPRSTSYGVYIS